MNLQCVKYIRRQYRREFPDKISAFSLYLMLFTYELSSDSTTRQKSTLVSLSSHFAVGLNETYHTMHRHFLHIYVTDNKKCPKSSSRGPKPDSWLIVKINLPAHGTKDELKSLSRRRSHVVFLLSKF